MNLFQLAFISVLCWNCLDYQKLPLGKISKSKFLLLLFDLMICFFFFLVNVILFCSVYCSACSFPTASSVCTAIHYFIIPLVCIPPPFPNTLSTALCPVTPSSNNSDFKKYRTKNICSLSRHVQFAPILFGNMSKLCGT